MTASTMVVKITIVVVIREPPAGGWRWARTLALVYLSYASAGARLDYHTIVETNGRDDQSDNSLLSCRSDLILELSKNLLNMKVVAGYNSLSWSWTIIKDYDGGV